MSGWTRPDAFHALDDAALLALIRGACAEAMKRGEMVVSAARSAILTEAELAAVRLYAQQQAAERLRAEQVGRVAEQAQADLRRAAREAALKEAAAQEMRAREEASANERRAWGRKKGTALAVEALLPEHAGLTVSVWSSASLERRVYINHGRRVQMACLYVTGNRHHPPGTLEMNTSLEPRRAEFLALLRGIARTWNALASMDVDSAAQWDGEALPLVEEPAP